MSSETPDRHWVDWHREYEDPTSRLSQRLAVVQRYLRQALEEAPDGELRLISMCAGQGRDVIPVLRDHGRRDDVAARLVELDPRNVSAAREAAEAAGLRRVEVVEADAGVTDAYAGAAPTDIALVCGVFGNVSEDDIAKTVRLLPSLCRPGAAVIWTRHRAEPDLTPAIRRWFGEAGFDEIAFEGPDDLRFGVGLNRLRVAPHPFAPGETLFRFRPT